MKRKEALTDSVTIFLSAITLGRYVGEATECFIPQTGIHVLANGLAHVPPYLSSMLRASGEDPPITHPLAQNAKRVGHPAILRFRFLFLWVW